MTLLRPPIPPAPADPLPARAGRPRPFAELMALYERNFERVHQLFPSIRHLTGTCRSDLAGSPPLWIQAIAQERHTSVVLLTHLFGREDGHHQLEPGAFVRVYHDARQAEVTHFRIGSALRPLFATETPVAQVGLRRLRLNRFFAKWLDFLETCGHGPHSFEAAGGALVFEAARINDVLTGSEAPDIICGSRVGL
jgi:uncharacterized protein